MQNKLILALDINNLKEAGKIIDEVKDYIGFYKIGSQLFSACGPAAIELVKKNGKKVFLDLKYHDIPNTVGESVREAASMGVDMITVHIIGGEEMLRRAVEAVKNSNSKTLVVGVTLLTSLDEYFLKEIGVKYSVEGFIVNLARLGKKSGLDGVVASSNETKTIRKEFGPDFVVVTPGIRLDDGEIKKDDQKRMASPAQAVKNGSSYIVVGRPILEAKDKIAVAKKILMEMDNAGTR